MSPEGQLLKLALRLMVDKQGELVEVLKEFQQEVDTLAKAAKPGDDPFSVNRAEVIMEFFKVVGSSLDMPLATDRDPKKILEQELSSRMHGLPEGGTFKIE